MINYGNWTVLQLLGELNALVKGECPSLLNDDSGGNGMLAIAIEEALASPAAGEGAKAAGSTLYVEVRECSNCQHVGINDDDGKTAACNTCEWSGPSPKKDHCPGCGRDGTMTSACPKCGERTHLLASATLAAGERSQPLMVDMTPPATARDRWMYEQGRLAERDPRSHPQPVAPGWALVPMEPTDKMTFVGQQMRHDSANSIGAIYNAMLAAAPAQPVAAEAGERDALLQEAENVIAALMRDTEDYGSPALIAKGWANDFMRKRAAPAQPQASSPTEGAYGSMSGPVELTPAQRAQATKDMIDDMNGGIEG